MSSAESPPTTTEVPAATTTTTTAPRIVEKNAEYYAEDPEILRRRGDWCHVKSRSSSNTYYYHLRTEKSMWTKPQEWVDAEEAEMRQAIEEQQMMQNQVSTEPSSAQPTNQNHSANSN